MKRTTARILASAALLAACSAANAQFGFSIPGFGNEGGKKNMDIAGMFDNINKATADIDEPGEIRIGQEFAAALLGAKPLSPDLRLQRYVNTLGRWLALQTERPDLPWTFGVLDDPGFNAFATPGGYIFVTQGLVNRMRSEAELAGVLAHEIAHVLRKHHLRAVQKNAGLALLGDFVGAAKQGGNTQAQAALLNVGRKLYASGLDQGDELEADRLGVVIAARAGYDPYGLPSVLQLLQAQSASDGGFALLFATHPAPGMRIEALGKSMEGRFDHLPAHAGSTIAERTREFGKK